MRFQKRRRTPPRWLAALVALAAAWCAPAVALAGAAQTDAKPLVFILLDTSGNMEVCLDLVDGNCEVDGEEPNSATVPLCHSSRQEGYNYSKSLWAAAVEVLTGTFIDFWCEEYDRPVTPTCSPEPCTPPPAEEDWEWYVRHALPRGVEVGGTEQSSNGLLDLYRDQVKFGLMTFDSNQNAGTGMAGGFSYGTTDGSGFNLGARNDGADFGAMVVPDPETDSTTFKGLTQNTNDHVQAEILATRPFGTTPTSDILYDALYVFENDDDVKDYDTSSDPATGDPYSDCRTRAVILIVDADGESTASDPDSKIAAGALYGAGVKVYVVGFQPTEDELDYLDEIAAAGGTEEAYAANNQAGLSSTLGEILVELRGNRPTRARSVLANRTLSFIDKQYQIFASFSPSISPLDEQGHLDQYVYRCTESCKPDGWEAGDGASLCEIFSLDDKLNERTADRAIYTQINGVLQAVTEANTVVTPEHLGVPTSRPFPQLDPEDLGNGQKLYSGLEIDDGEEDISADRQEYYEQLLRLIRGDLTGRRGEARLGAIVHSEPVVQADLYSMTIPVPSFRYYRTLEGVVDRPTVLFVGTHEGMLHAFRVDRLAEDDSVPPAYDHGLSDSGDDYGEELWGFIPKHLLEKADSLAEGMNYLLDGDPIIREVRLYKTLSEIGESPLSLLTEAERWRSVLLTGYGDGGRGYFAMDVTYPDLVSRTADAEDKFQFMWEISNTEVCNATDGCSVSTAFENLGTSESAAAIGAAYFRDSTTLVYQEKAIAIFGGGGAVVGEPDSGLAIYVVDLATGAVIQEFCNDTLNCGTIIDNGAGDGSVDGFDCPITGDVTAFDDTPGASVTRAFVGDSCGQIWRIDMTHYDPANWTAERFYDAFSELSLDPSSAEFDRRRPVKIRPSTAIGYQRGQLILVAGTGNPDESAGAEADRVFSIKEAWDATDEEYGVFVNWDMALDSGETYTGEPVIFDEAAYFTTLAPSEEGSCAVGAGRLWGVHYTGTNTLATDDIESELDLTEDPDREGFIEFTGAELYGLQLVQRSPCTDSTLNYAPWLGDGIEATLPDGGIASAYSPAGSATFGTGTSGGALELVVQTSDLGVSDSEMQAPGGNATGTGTKKIVGVSTPAQSVFSASWGLLFD